MYQDLSKYRFTLPRGHSKLFILFYMLVDSLFIKPSPKPLTCWRNMIYRLFGAKIGKNVKIDPKAELYSPWNIEIGDNVWIGAGCNLYNVDKIKIGNNVCISYNTFLATASHDFHKIDFPTISAPITIEDEVWISTNSLVLQGVTIHRGAVIGACSLVTNDIEEGMIAMGQPAKPVKKRKEN